MARKDLIATLEHIEAKIMKSSQEFRRLVSDREAHTVNIDKKDLIFQVSAEMKFRLGMKELPDSMNDTIEKEVTDMVRKFFVALHPRKFNTARKAYETSGLKGTKTSFSVTYAAKEKTDTTNVFKRFKRGGTQLGDLDKDGKMSGYEKVRQKAIEKSMAAQRKK